MRVMSPRGSRLYIWLIVALMLRLSWIDFMDSDDAIFTESVASSSGPPAAGSPPSASVATDDELSFVSSPTFTAEPTPVATEGEFSVVTLPDTLAP